MEKTCLKCGLVNEEAAGAPAEACPKCGAIYAKVEQASAAKQAAAQKAANEKAEKERVEATRAAAREEQARQSQQRADEQARSAALASAVCMACGHVGNAKRKVGGTFLAEIGLWVSGLFLTVTIVFLHFGMLLLFVAFCYSIWRVFSRRRRVCAKCGSETIIPGDSPRGREELARQGLLRP